MKTKEELLDMLEQDLVPLFEALKECMGKDNDRLNALAEEYINPPGTFSQAQFMNRVRMFISMFYSPAATQPATPAKSCPDYYNVLCALDFKLQSRHFKRIYKNKKLSAFLLHGDGAENDNDLRWLCNQLLYQHGMSAAEPVIIDLGAKIGGSYDRMIDEFSQLFKLDMANAYNKNPVAKIRRKFERRLETDHFVCMVKSPDSLLGNTSEIERFFNEFLYDVNRNIDFDEYNYSLIFLFIDQKPVNYHRQFNKYFICYDQSISNYATHVTSCPDLKIIDLAPVSSITAKDLENWLDWSQEDTETHNMVKSIAGKENEILSSGTRPHEVIREICKQILKIDFNNQWIQ